jgi:branched-chain amino acid transport system substrate-binding protein
MRADVLRRLALGALAVALTMLAAGCGGGSAEAIRIGILADCEGLFSPLHEETLAGAELPLLARGAKLRGPTPSDGVTGATVAGKHVELVFGCLREFSRASTVAALRRLVEQEHADIVVGSEGPADGLVIRDYAKRRPGVTFVYAGFDQSASLVDPAPNVFRFRVTMAQWAAGLGTYAYRDLGWRNAVTIGGDGAPTWSGVAGFVAEFCSLGGNIVRRLWLQGDDLGALVAKIPKRGVDGVFLPTSLYGTESFVAAWSARHTDLGHWLVGGDVLLSQNPNDRRLLGVVAANPTPWGPTRAWSTYTADFDRAFAGLKLEAGNALNLFDSTEPVLEALEQVHGDVTHGERRLMAALAHLTFDSPEGPRRLDSRHQAVGLMYLGKMVKDKRGKLEVRQIRVVTNVEQTFGGHLSPTAPAPSRTQPACSHGNPPSWAR